MQASWKNGKRQHLLSAFRRFFPREHCRIRLLQWLTFSPEYATCKFIVLLVLIYQRVEETTGKEFEITSDHRTKLIRGRTRRET